MRTTIEARQIGGMSPSSFGRLSFRRPDGARDQLRTTSSDSRGFRRNLLLLLAAGVVVSLLAVGTVVAAPLRIWFNRNVLLGSATWPQRAYLVVERVGKDGAVVFLAAKTGHRSCRSADSQVIPRRRLSRFPRARSRCAGRYEEDQRAAISNRRSCRHRAVRIPSPRRRRVKRLGPRRLVSSCRGESEDDSEPPNYAGNRAGGAGPWPRALLRAKGSSLSSPRPQ